MVLIEVDENTARALELAARVSKSTPGGVVAMLVREAAPKVESSTESTPPAAQLAVLADYEGHRTRGMLTVETGRLEISSGPLSGQSFKTPTGAAKAVIAHAHPGISPNRNGWEFWMLDDGSARPIKAIRGQ